MMAIYNRIFWLYSSLPRKNVRFLCIQTFFYDRKREWNLPGNTCNV